MSNNNLNKKPVTYTQIKILGVGSFGKAYLVECNDDKVKNIKIKKKKYAVIKTMIIENMDEQEKKEALLEAKILEKLDHQNIIKFREVFMARKPVFTLNIVMDFADGGDMQSKIKEQKGKYFPEEQIMDWFTQICLAIKHIHDKKILHRDLKSQNIFLTKNGLIKLGDFGIAKCLNFTLEKAKTVVGTPYYLSPEIVENKPYSFKSDIWSLGVLLYEMVCLRMPFDASSLPMLYVKIVRGNYNPIPNIYSKDLKNLIALLLCTNVEQRTSINDILKLPYMKKKIRSFLSEMDYNSEFSSTLVKNYEGKKEIKIEKPINNYRKKDDKSDNKNSDKKEKEAINNLLRQQPVENKEKNQIIVSNNNNSQNKKINIDSSGNGNSENSSPQKQRKDKDVSISDFIKNKKGRRSSEINSIDNSNVSKDNISLSTNNNSNSNVNNNSNHKKTNSNYDPILIEEKEKNEKKNDLKDFMKKKKHSNNNQAQGDIILIKGIDDVVNNTEEGKKKQINKSHNNENSDEDIKNKKDSKDKNKREYSAKKDKEDYVDCHKMYLDLDNIAKELNSDESVSKAEEYDANDLNNDTRDFNILDDSSNEGCNINTVYDFDKNANNLGNRDSDSSIIESLIKELEEKLGLKLFKDAYDIIQDNTDPYLFKCDSTLMKKLIVKKLGGKYSNSSLNKAIENIPEIYSIILKEREMMYW